MCRWRILAKPSHAAARRTTAKLAAPCHAQPRHRERAEWAPIWGGCLWARNRCRPDPRPGLRAVAGPGLGLVLLPWAFEHVKPRR